MFSGQVIIHTKKLKITKTHKKKGKKTVKEVQGKTGYLQNLLVSENVRVCTNRKICAPFFLMSIESRARPI